MSSTGYVIPVDPSELASRFSTSYDAGADADLDEAENVSDEDVAQFFPANDYESLIAPLLDRIPEKEADLIFLYFFKRKRQLDIAHMFGITQAAVSYRLERGIERLRFLLSIPQITEEDLLADLPEVFPATSACPKCNAKSQKPTLKVVGHCTVCESKGTILIDVAILIGMWKTTCQSEVATALGLTQGRVRHRFFKAVEVLKEVASQNEKYGPYERIFSSVADGKAFNILREVRLPQWSNRGQDGCL